MRQLFNRLLLSLMIVPLVSGCLAPQGPANFFKRAKTSNYNFVVTPAKLGLPKTNWTVRENVVFRKGHWPDVPNYLGSRGFEFRYDLHPAEYWQEFHTTINVFRGKAPAWELSGDIVDTVKIGMGITATYLRANDVDNTFTIAFVCANYQVNVKMKFSTWEYAEKYLLRSAKIVLNELCR